MDKLIFASGEKDKNGIIVIGSLYFKDGFRIRLCHRGGPGVSEHKTTTQYCLKNDEATNRFNFLADPIYDIPVIKMALEQLDEDSDEFDVVKALGEKRTIKDWLARIEALEDREKTPRDIEQTLFEEGRIELAGENVSGTLLEIDDDNVHISAGGPVPVPSDMNQNRLNALLRAANTGNNVAMQLCFEHVAKN